MNGRKAGENPHLPVPEVGEEKDKPRQATGPAGLVLSPAGAAANAPVSHL
ncbi:hypothetical protein GCM10019060_32030 [Novosphingobium pokkalii]|nr:hypothetical protein GCM10019060_32030 [Novosphingobium pokkalii]